MIKILMTILLASLTLVSGKRYCYFDSDCSGLGNMVCAKSMCWAGVCACRRGYAARFMGSQRQFQCVKIRKIGENCSTDYTAGVCGGQNSECVQRTCRCQTGTTPTFESRWGGEVCLPVKELLTSTESCSDGLGSAAPGDTCLKGHTWGTPYDGSLASLTNHPLDGVPNVVSCPQQSQTILEGDFGDAEFMGGLVPKCEPLKIGDLCLSDADCEHIQLPEPAPGTGWRTGGAYCGPRTSSSERRTCHCVGAHTPDITGMYCSMTMLNYGEPCTLANIPVSSQLGMCNGTSGLRCGDPCNTDMLDDVAKRDLFCTCDPGWKVAISGSGCDPVSDGDYCYGDYNCKSLGPGAVCTSGRCRPEHRFTSGSRMPASVPALAWSSGSLVLMWLRWQQ